MHYRLVPEQRTEFSETAKPVEAHAGAFSVRLDGGDLTFEMHDHFASAFEAFDVVESYLRAWEVRHALAVGDGRPEFHFRMTAWGRPYAAMSTLADRTSYAPSLSPLSL